MPAATPDYSKYAAIIVALVALGYTVYKDYKTNKRLKKVEQEQEREKAETAIRRSKASGPFLSPSTKVFNLIYEREDNGGIAAWSVGTGNVLSTYNLMFKTDAPEATPVIMPLDNSGKAARRIRITGDLKDIQLKQEPDISDASGMIFLKYPFKRADLGKAQKVIFTFETEDGFDLTHTYEMKHGEFVFNRIDPK